MRQSFLLQYILLLIAQVLICNYFHFTPYLTLTLLPALILCLPTRLSTAAGMLIAFVTGITVDLLAEGVVGLNAFALVPVGLLRRGLVRFVFGEELLVRGENFSIHKFGLPKVIFAVFLMQTVFLVLYIWADGAPVRPFLFNFWRYFISGAAGTLLSVVVADLFTHDDRR